MAWEEFVLAGWRVDGRRALGPHRELRKEKRQGLTAMQRERIDLLEKHEEVADSGMKGADEERHQVLKASRKMHEQQQVEKLRKEQDRIGSHQVCGTEPAYPADGRVHTYYTIVVSIFFSIIPI